MRAVHVRQLDDYALTLIRVLAVLLVLAAVVWVLITPGDWTSCLVLVGAAVPLAILGGGR